MDTAHSAYDEVYVYAMGRPGFILQHVVDVYAVQCADPGTKAISLIFGLVGLYLHVEKRFSGRQVQLVHMKLASRKRKWSHPNLPDNRGEFTVFEVLKAPAGLERDQAIEMWCKSVWAALSTCRSGILALLEECKINESCIR